MIAIVIDEDQETIEDVCIALRLFWPEPENIVHCTQQGKDGLALIKSKMPDLVILGHELSDVSGFDVLAQIRQDSDVSVIFLSSRKDEIEIVKALDMGADEYMVKPFGQMELLARINNLTRRRQ